MSQHEERDNSGSAFFVQDKKSDSHADFSGKVMIDGKKYWINIWKKQTRNGDNFFSISFRDRVEGRQNEPRRDRPFEARRAARKDETPW